jgi:hypothetical protein
LATVWASTPLRRVDEQQRALARRQRARDLVGKIHVAGRVGQVQLVGLPVLGWVVHDHRMHLDGDAPFLLEIHGVEMLVGHLAFGDRARVFEQAVGQGRLSVIDVRDDAEIACELGGHLRRRCRSIRRTT